MAEAEPMRIAVIGVGAIGRYVAEALGRDGPGPEAMIVRSGPPDDPVPGMAYVRSVGDLPDGITHVIDCAGHAGLSQHGPVALGAGIDVITLSLGALADAGLTEALTHAARQGGAKLHLASGAIGALDALRAAAVGGLAHVTYMGRKPPMGWAGSPAEELLDLAALRETATHFEGPAREAALRYPKNANVAAAVALAGLGFDATQVRLIADPEAEGNIHEIEAEGAFGRLAFRITGNALPDNPRSSALAAMSAVAEIRRLAAPVST
jgi:aspartate dehydrogenase